MSLLAASNIYKSYGSVPVLKGVSLAVSAGEIVSLVGPSGSGKSTLLRCLNLLEVPDQGELLWRGQKVPYLGISPRQLSLHRRRLGMVFQQFNLFPHMTALGNVMEGPVQVLGWSRERAAEVARDLLDRVGLLPYAERWPARLSGGQKQRVAIARALAMQPDALLLDEVTSALDVEASADINALLRELAQAMTMVVVTHDLAFAQTVSQRVIFLEKGEVIEAGPPEQVLGQPSTERARRFLAAKV